MLGAPIGWPIGGGITEEQPAPAGGTYFGARYWGSRYWGARYWGTAPPVTEIIGAFDATEAADVAAFVVDVVEIVGTLDAAEEADTADVQGFVETPTTTDWEFPTAHTIINGGGWINPENIYAKDGANTEAHHDEVGVDWFLKTEGYGIGPAVIPDDAIILKVELEVKWNVAPP